MSASAVEEWAGRTALVEHAGSALGSAIEAGLEQCGVRVLLEGEASASTNEIALDLLVLIEGADARSLGQRLDHVARRIEARLPAMTQRGYGRIVIVRPSAQDQPSASASSFRAALVGLMRFLAQQAGPCGVTINAIELGVTELEPEEADVQHELLRRTPIGRAVSASELIAAVLFLASPRAGYITGAALPLNGGMGLGLFPAPTDVPRP